MLMNKQLEIIGRNAKKAANYLKNIDEQTKNKLLNQICIQLEKNSTLLIKENKKDLINAQKHNLSQAMIERLTLTKKGIASMIESVRQLILLNDPTGKTLKSFTTKEGLKISKVSTPIGVIGIIFESRPNVSLDSAIICLKAGNASILRGGKEAFYSNKKIIEIIQESAKLCNIPTDFVQLIPHDRKLVKHFVQMNNFIDLIIPRGGESLIQTVTKNATIPVIKHYKGVCHIYVSQYANCQKALNIIKNAKCQRPAVCNATEAILVHKNIAKNFLPKLEKQLANVEIYASKKTLSFYQGNFQKASKSDRGKEYLDLKAFVHTVNSTQKAIDYINTYGSHHSDAIISEKESELKKFTKLVDSSTVYSNASTRFTDGSIFGMGAEIGISTDKIHARGPMGLNELTTYKFIVEGSGQIRS